MKLSTLEVIGEALATAGVSYLIVGGVAVNAHGHQRLTLDLDLVLRLTSDNVLKALKALDGLGYQPLLPVVAEEFADPERRKEWIAQRNMQVFSLVSDEYRDTTIDLFVTEPFDYETEYRHALVTELNPGLQVRFVRLQALIEMKEATGRPLDLDDVRHLRWIAAELAGQDADAPE